MTSSDLQDVDTLAHTIFSLRFEAMPLWIQRDKVAYLDDRSGVMHLFLANPETGERRQLTSGAERIQTICGVPGIDHVVVGTDAGGNERQQLKLVDLDGGSEMMLSDNMERIHEPFVMSPDGRSILYRVNDGESGEFSLCRMDVDSRESTTLWNDAGQVQAHAVNARGDALVSILTSSLDADLYLVSSDGQRSALFQETGESWILDAAFGPHGRHALVLTNAGRDHVSLQRVELRTGARSTLIEEPGNDIEAFALSPDGQRVAWSVNRDGYSLVRFAEVAHPDRFSDANLPDGVMDHISWSPSGDAFAIGWTPTTGPSRIYRIKFDDDAMQMFENEPNDGDFRGKAPELIEFETFDKRMIPAFWFEAEDADAPVIIDVHGGPESQRRPGFHPVLQHLVASGFNVLTTNVRGSTGYGKEYSHLDDVELRMDSVRDLVHAQKWIVANVPGSENRIGIMGQSYGGFMTLAAITEYPDLWFAAVDIVGISNFVSFLERTGPWRRRHRESEYGSLANDRAFLEKISPIRKVDDIRAPLFVIHGRNDPRVPLHETEQLIGMLEARNHPVEAIVYDDEGHGLSKRTNRISGYTAAVDFLRRTFERSEA